ncbi:two-component system sensor histidine kinase NtrB [Paenibacillus wynnii]|uniref:two-component system sensor histidine kinase NtrB n=1 Tax=Paenibacillus wynnii TaxID=268407 RepID=UPI002792A372|nr:ATP-binding protein [Paenibacillus wynnii]MDQ0195212.1 signal transduction histidine kinase [Paenibacillus wynnii]
MLLNSGILVYPLLFGMSAQFKKGTVIEKMGLLWMALFPSMLFITLVPIFEGKELYEPQSSNALLIAIYLFVTFVLGGTLIFFIETVWDKFHIKVEMEGITRRFQWESDKLQQITNVVPLCIMSLDENGNIAGINELMLELVRRRYPLLTKTELLEQNINHFLDIIEDKQIVQRIKNSIFYKQREFVKLSGNSRTYHIYSSPLIQRGTQLPEGMLLVVQDMTEEENMRNELDNVERLTLVGQMAAGITHEIRNPMAVVRGFLQLMREKSPDNLHSYYHIVMEELDRANSIINDFLSLAQSRISVKERVLLHGIIEDLSPLLWADANLRGQIVELKLDPSMPLLQLNVREMKQLILNLGRNGMEAMGSKGVLTLETRITPDRDRVELIIRDTGNGISEIEREKLFVPFFTTKSQGTGLGLPLCLNIVERHHGKITVQSQQGVGTEFIVSFPCETDEAPIFAIAE